jgi:CHAT domain-containing protein/Tfp pilus assembly protein PilF
VIKLKFKKWFNFILTGLITSTFIVAVDDGLSQSLSRQEYRNQLQTALKEQDNNRIKKVLTAQRGEALRFIEFLLDSSVIKKAGGKTSAGDSDWTAAKTLADVYAESFADDFYIQKANRYHKFTPEAISIKTQIIDLKNQSRENFYQGDFQGALEKYQQALKLTEKINDVDDEGAIWGNIGAVHFYLGEFDIALEYYQKSLTLLEKIGDKRRIGNRIGNIASVYNDKSDYSTALAFYDKAIKIREEIDDKRGLAADLNNMGLIYDEMGDYDKALTHYQKALELNRLINNERSIGKNLANIANVHINLGDYLEALQIYDRALQIRRAMEDKKGEGNDYGNIGIVYQSLGDYKQAMSFYQKALQIHQEIGFREGEGYQLGRIAELQAAKGEYADAIKTFQEAFKIHQEMGHLHGAADWLSALSQVYFAVGDHKRALENLQQALDLHKKIGDRNGEAATLNKLGSMLFKTGKIDSAKICFQTALQVHKKTGEKWGECNSLINLSFIHREEGRFDFALKYLQNSKGIADDLGENLLQAWVQFHMGELYRLNKKTKEARSAYDKGLAISEGLYDPELRWQIYYGLGQLGENEGNDERAYYSYYAAIKVIEDIRRKAVIEEFRAGVMHNRFEAYEALILTLIRLGRTEEAFEIVERARARNLLDLMKNTKIMGKESFSKIQIEKVNTLQRKISALSSQFSFESVSKKGTQRGRADEYYKKSLNQAQEEYQRLLIDLKLRNPEYAALVEAEPLSSSNIRLLLDEKSVLLEYFVTKNNILIFVITKDKLQQITVPEGFNSLRGKITLFRGTAVRQMNEQKLEKRPWIKPLEKLYRILIEPVQQAGFLNGKKHLIIVPQGLLHYLPFQALITSNESGNTKPHFLVEDYIISYLPSASVLKYCREKNTNKKNNLLLLAPRIEQLPMSEEEISDISDSFGKNAEKHSGEDATESLVKQKGSNFDLLHFATTAHFNKTNPMFSKLDMAESESDDGSLEVHEIFNLDLKASLIVLSACQTALGSGYSESMPKGDDLVSLTRAFMFAGSPSVVASLWEIFDPSTAVFMARFYENLKNNNKATALALTQREMINKNFADNGNLNYTHPYHWASFVLVGDWE